MMRRYPAYRDSGVEWLGEVPLGWTILRIRFVAKFSSGGTPNRDNLELWGGDIPWVSPKDMKTARIISTEEKITEKGLAESAASLLEAGTVLLVARSGILKHTIPVAINSVPVATNQDIKALHFDRLEVLPEFFVYFVEGYNNQLLLLWAKQGATVESIEHQYLANSLFPIPPLTEQTAIAAFLDRETAKIDALVDEQRRLIALLREKRQAVISHAVTKGLNPAAPMKPSGVDWLGDVPADWTVVRFSQAVDFQEGPGILAVDFADDGVPLMRIAGVQGRWATLSGCNYLDPEKVQKKWDHFRLKLGDLVISASATMGTVSEVEDEAVGAIPYTGLIRLWPKSDSILKDYIRSLVTSSLFSTQIDLLKAGATIKHFGPTHLSQVRIMLPPIEEQMQIAHYIESQHAKFDHLLNAAESAISLLQERRAALISAAVTGKIDVRDLASARTEAA